MNEMTTCRFCGGEVEPSAQKCRHCGEWLDRAAGRKASGDLHPAVKAAAITLMVLLAALFVMNYWG